MSDILERAGAKDTEKQKERLVVDGRYVREQAGEAAAIFLAPVSGILRVLVGRKEADGGSKRAA